MVEEIETATGRFRKSSGGIKDTFIKRKVSIVLITN